jgi:hypothetical protein
LRRIKARAPAGADHHGHDSPFPRPRASRLQLAGDGAIQCRCQPSRQGHRREGCHAIGRVGRSALSDATPFRDIGRKYPISNLEEAFGEGDTANHKGMPDFVLTPRQVADLLDYIRAVQPKRR